MPGPKDFALLIGKKLDAKDSGKTESEPELALPSSVTDSDGGEVESDGMADSACADMMAALKEDNVPMFKMALKDFIQLIDMNDEA